MEQFPRTEVEGLSLSRMIIGTNWIGGWSHRSVSADKMITQRHSTTATIVPMLETFMSYGVDTIMAPFQQLPVLVRAIRETEDKLGKGMIIIDTPQMNMDDTREARAEARKVFEASKALGAKICLIHHYCAAGTHRLQRRE